MQWRYGTIGPMGIPTQVPTGADVVRAAEDLVPLLRERAAEIDDQRAIPEEIYRAVQDAGLLQHPQAAPLRRVRAHRARPRDGHADAREGLRVHRMGLRDPRLRQHRDLLVPRRRRQEEIWGANPGATLAGNTNLNPAAEVERVPGGYRLSGTWGYCSGSDFSEWLIFNAPVGEAGEGHMFIVAGEEAETIDDWWPTGMRGTGSRSKRVDRVFVPGRRVMRTADTTVRLEERRSLHATFDATYAPWPSHGRFPFAATAVGAAAGAAEDFGESSGSLTRVAHALGGTTRLVEQDYVATEFAEASGELDMAWDLVARDSREAAEYAGRHELPDERLLAKLHRDNALVTRVSLREVSRIHALVGAKAGFPGHPDLAGEARRRDGRRARDAQLAPGRRSLPRVRRVALTPGRPASLILDSRCATLPVDHALRIAPRTRSPRRGGSRDLPPR